jgi:hypothetical protein
MDIASVFKWFAQESINVAERANEPEQREKLLKLALMWETAAQQCRDLTAGICASPVARGAGDSHSSR